MKDNTFTRNNLIKNTSFAAPLNVPPGADPALLLRHRRFFTSSNRILFYAKFMCF